MPLHKLVCVTRRSHIDSHCRTVVSKVVADSAPANCHGVILCGIARTKNQIFGEESETVLLKFLLHIKSLETSLLCSS